eukprot:scaffold77399_cov76-Phaeocystis_antarctica.AAC.5
MCGYFIVKRIIRPDLGTKCTGRRIRKEIDRTRDLFNIELVDSPFALASATRTFPHRRTYGFAAGIASHATRTTTLPTLRPASMCATAASACSTPTKRGAPGRTSSTSAVSSPRPWRSYTLSRIAVSVRWPSGSSAPKASPQTLPTIERPLPSNARDAVRLDLGVVRVLRDGTHEQYGAVLGEVIDHVLEQRAAHALLTTRVTPSARAAAAFSSLPTVPTTVAPRATASCTANEPVAPQHAVTTTTSPLLIVAVRPSAVAAVRPEMRSATSSAGSIIAVVASVGGGAKHALAPSRTYSE